ncbi:MAG: prephenate dehydratase [Bacillota bacterium]
MDGKLGYLGPAGTFSEEAALLYNRTHNFELIERPTVAQVMEGVAAGSLEQGVVPLENSLEGSISITLDLLVQHSGIQIYREIIYPVRQCLLVFPGTALEQITQVISHPHALGQCRNFLNTTLQNAACRLVESTAAAAAMVAALPGSAAIAPRRAAALFHLDLLVENIQDNDDNVTRFVVIARQEHSPTGHDKTSLVLTVPDGPGSLYSILGFFAHRKINLTRIESRPARRSLGDWFFFIDCEGHRCDPSMAGLWEELAKQVSFIKLLGSYPCAKRLP